MLPVAGLIGAGVSLITDWFKTKREVKKAEVESSIAIQKAKTEAVIEKMRTRQEGDIAWENTAIGNSGWKDEYWTIVLSIPAIMCFIPGMDVYVYAGFKALNECPEWYRWALLVSVAASFGYRKIADFMSLRKGV